ncbi:52 kDa repressor of the inhibitor of the protein kinase-like [Hydra vulgaris]|uniref:52 kDa repressor of the inhibitor of the protein kinase-like n=1 Tax=Hydra vulgaris TaxID=6087 RepID=UPI0032E9FDDE
MPTNVLNAAEWRSNFLLFSNEYEDELPEPRYIMTELNMWEAYWRSFKNSLPTTLTKLLPFIDRITFPNIFTLIQILATIPVTTCTCERSISVIRHLKTYLRNTMSQNRFNSLALMHVHQDISIDVNEVIDCFARKNPRRMKLVDILNSDPI